MRDFPLVVLIPLRFQIDTFRLVLSDDLVKRGKLSVLSFRAKREIARIIMRFLLAVLVDDRDRLFAKLSSKICKRCTLACLFRQEIWAAGGRIVDVIPRTVFVAWGAFGVV
jgi:hypothetical protein